MLNVDILNATIFVSIAAYRDYETRNTINDLFAKAKNKKRVFVGVFSQIDLENEKNLIIGDRTNVREIIMDSKFSKGCTWARSFIFDRLLKDEEFTFQIDAHSRFDENWDVKLLEEYNMLEKADSVISTYPPAFTLDKPIDTSKKHVFMKFRDFHTSGLPVFLSDVTNVGTVPSKPRITPCLSAGCLFGPSRIFKQIPYDPYVYFFGEEQSYAIRLYTHGIDTFVPRTTFMYHLYYDSKKDKKNLHWNDVPKEVGKDLTTTGVERVKYILGMTDIIPHGNDKDLDLYGLGTVRTVQQWEEFAGVDLKTSTSNEIGRNGHYHLTQT